MAKKKAQARLEVEQNKEKPIQPKVLAESIVKMSSTMQDLLRTGLNRRAVVTLVADKTKMGKATIDAVLDALEQLKRDYTSL